MKKIYYILLVLLLLPACSKTLDINQEPDGLMCISFRTAAVRQASTKAMGTVSQNAISDLYMLAYDASTNKLVYVKKASIIRDSNADGSVKMAFFPYIDTERHDNLKLRFYANVDENAEISAMISALVPGTSVLDGADANLLYSCASAWNATSDEDYDALPMWGGPVDSSSNRSDAAVTLLKGENATITVDMMRAMARVNVAVSGVAGWEGVKIKSVKIYNVLSQGYVNAFGDKLTSEYRVNAPSVGALSSVTSRTYDLATAQLALNNTIFIPETPALNDPYLIVGLTDGVEVKYIKLAFLDNSANYMDILRSNSYTFMINTSEQLGLLGYDTEAQAAASIPENYHYSVSVIADSYHNHMVTDENYVLYLYDDKVTFPLSGGTSSFMVYTTYPDGWTVSNWESLPADCGFYKKDEPETNYLNGFNGLANLNYYTTIKLDAHAARSFKIRIKAGPHLYKDILIVQE